MANFKTDLSIIIPVYNTEKYLSKALDSILKNIPNNTEIIIINDGSTDNCDQIIQKYLKKYPDLIKYYKRRNYGLSATKNFGLKYAKGKYITFVDSDDYINIHMHQLLLDTAKQNNADLVYCDVNLVYNDGKIVYSHCTNYNQEDKLMKHLDVPLMAASWNKIVKKTLFYDLKYPEGINNEDVAVTPILFTRSSKIIKIDKPLYNYYQRNDSIQNKKFSEKRFDIFKSAKLCFESAKEFNEDIQEKIKGCIYTHQLLAIYYYLISNFKLKDEIYYTKLFLKNMNEFDDYFNNKYVIEYMNNLYASKYLKLIKENNIFKLIIYNHYKKVKKLIKNLIIKTKKEN